MSATNPPTTTETFLDVPAAPSGEQASTTEEKQMAEVFDMPASSAPTEETEKPAEDSGILSPTAVNPTADTPSEVASNENPEKAASRPPSATGKISRPPSAAPTTTERPASATATATATKSASRPSSAQVKPTDDDQPNHGYSIVTTNPTSEGNHSRPPSAAQTKAPTQTHSRPPSAAGQTKAPTETHSRPPSAAQTKAPAETNSRPASAREHPPKSNETPEHGYTIANHSSRPPSAAPAANHSRPPSAMKQVETTTTTTTAATNTASRPASATPAKNVTEPIIGRPPSAVKTDAQKAPSRPSSAIKQS